MDHIDNTVLVTALGRLEAEITVLTSESLLVVLSKDERAHLARARDGFAAAARTLIHAAKAKPGLTQASDFDADAVLEVLDNVDALAPVITAVAELFKQLEDSRLAWLADAYGPTLTLYKMARVRAEDDGHLRDVVAPLAEIFKAAPSKPAEPAEPDVAPAAPPVGGA